jgi:hypothetical protein
MRGALFWYGLLACLICAPSWSAENQKDKTKNDAQTSKSDLRGTTDSPFAVEANISERSQEQLSEEHEQEKNKASVDAVIAYSTFGLAVVTALLALCTLGLMIFTSLLWMATGTLVRDAKRTSRQQLRAYVYESAKDEPRQVGDAFLASFDIHNSGSTPAYDVCCWARLVPVMAVESATYEFEAAPVEIVAPRFVVNPNSLHSQTVATGDLEPEAILNRLMGVALLHLWGEIRYLDAFGDQHACSFRLLWHVHGGMGQWLYHEHGNKADREPIS